MKQISEMLEDCFRKFGCAGKYTWKEISDGVGSDLLFLGYHKVDSAVYGAGGARLLRDSPGMETSLPIFSKLNDGGNEAAACSGDDTDTDEDSREGAKVAGDSNGYTEPVDNKHDFLNGAHWCFTLGRILTPTESVVWKLHEDSTDYTPRVNLDIDLFDKRPFRVSIERERGMRLASGQEQFTLGEMRTCLRDDKYREYLSNTAAGDTQADLSTEPAEEEDEQDAAAEIANIVFDKVRGRFRDSDQENDGNNAKLAHILRCLIYVVQNNIQGCCRRAQWDSVVKMVMAGGQVQLAARPLPQSHLLQTIRVFPMPCGCRGMDVVPMAVMANAFKAGLLLSNLDKDADEVVPTYRRLPIAFSRTRLNASPFEKSAPVVMNALLLRGTGRVWFLRDLSRLVGRLAAGDDVSGSHPKFGLPLKISDGDESTDGGGVGPRGGPWTVLAHPASSHRLCLRRWQIGEHFLGTTQAANTQNCEGFQCFF